MERSGKAPATRILSQTETLLPESDWIEDFIESTEHVNSPLIHRKWSAIATVSAAMERRVWTRVRATVAYPNLFVMLVGGPGVGKSESTWRSRDMLETLKGHFIGETSLTPAALVDSLFKAKRSVIMPTAREPVLTFNHLSLVIDELGVFLPNYDSEMLARLTHIWDCREYSEARRSIETPSVIPNPCLNILTGCTPDYLIGTLPESAWSQGFMTRVLMVYSGERKTPDEDDLWAETPEDILQTKNLQAGLKRIFQLAGPMAFTQESMDAMRAWRRGGEQPVPEHPKLFHYTMRRVHHLVKLCMVSSAARSSDMVITLEDFQRALGWLLDAEFRIPDIFRAMSGSTDGRLMEETFYFLFQESSRHGGKALPEARIYHFIAERTPSHNVERIINIMIKRNMMERIPGGFKPRGRIGQ